MPYDCIDLSSTSSTTADATPLVLNQTDLIRLSFLPSLVENPHEPGKAINGKLLFEKKKKCESYFPSDIGNASVKVSRGSVKVNDWMEIKLSTGETFELYQGLKNLYALHDSIEAVPHGVATYVRVDSIFKQFLSLIQNDPSAARMIGSPENYDLIKQLLRLITQTESRDSLKQSLSNLENSNLDQLSTTLSIEKLQRVARLMEENMENSSEEFWQSEVFKENQWVLAQIFSTPCTICEDKAYVGGKAINNRDGNVCDFIYQNKLSQNVSLIEIKTPCTPIIAKNYRATYSFSHEMSGAVNQVLNYKDFLTKSFYNLRYNSSSEVEVFSPKCVVVIGKLASMSSSQIAAFENFRNNLNNVLVITFDELYARITDLIAILSDEDNN